MDNLSITLFFSRTIYDLSWCHQSDLIATACADDTIRIFRQSGSDSGLEENFELATSFEKAHSQDVNCVAWNPKESGLLASCSDDGEVKIWQLDGSE